MQTLIKKEYAPAYQNIIIPPIRDSFYETSQFVRSIFCEVYKEYKLSKGKIRSRSRDLIFKNIERTPFVQSLIKYEIELDSLEIQFKNSWLLYNPDIEYNITSVLNNTKKFIILVDLKEKESAFLRLKRLYKSDKIIVILIDREGLADLYELFKKADFVGFDSYLQGLVKKVTNDNQWF